MNKAKKRVAARISVGVDTGGTFTDFVFFADNRLHVFKLPSTPKNPAEAIRAGLQQVARRAGHRVDHLDVVHGTTVGTNALLERTGARIALITTRGFEDVLAIGRQARPELYNLDVTRPPSLVEDGLRLGVKERISPSGEVLVALDPAALSGLVRRLRNKKVEAVAISLLFSFVNNRHELQIATSLEPLGIPLSISHQILPEYREYERTSTVAINAYLQPLMGAYLEKLQTTTKNLRVMQSSGGIISANVAAREPVRTILSGPSGGVVGATNIGRLTGRRNLITFDMGGTSTDVALCLEAQPRTTNEAMVAGLPVAVPVLDIHTVGAGGGSIARVDDGGSLKVGPQSAGADPGPACYGKSDLATVTDAHLVLGHFPEAKLLGGDFDLDVERARLAMRRLADDMSRAARRKITIEVAAEGVIAVVNNNMERALRSISIERGFDPREFVLLPFGGAGGLHAFDLARALQIPRVVVPSAGGALSAIGVMTADVVQDLSRTVMVPAEQVGTSRSLARVFRELEHDASRRLEKEGFRKSQQRHQRLLAMRYLGQSFELDIEWTRGDLAKRFHRAHRVRYGYEQTANPVEIVSARLRSKGLAPPMQRERWPSGGSSRVRPHSVVSAWFAGKQVKTAVHPRERLLAGNKFRGPAIVTEYSATILVPPSGTARVDSYGNIIIDTV